ncbi:EF-hand protein [Nadsonia fulvescens var. elongata DSM 6958]|uniref:EF-hand protein n=1 Tax=Nadsonia fulvescens var. elongata DSM 6958 TaxID=857566 RepID=A0A1E3PFS7_9ASCO|nr:EF-hand protein [Nadsonia fulvescens var. elongata DSM 6958]
MESFALLDHDNDGLVSRADLASMLTSLGQATDPATLDQFFKDNGKETMTMASYVTTMQRLMGEIVPANDLHTAFQAFHADKNETIRTATLEKELKQAGMDPEVITQAIAEFSKSRFANEEFDYKLFIKTLCGPDQ